MKKEISAFEKWKGNRIAEIQDKIIKAKINNKPYSEIRKLQKELDKIIKKWK